MIRMRFDKEPRLVIGYENYDTGKFVFNTKKMIVLQVINDFVVVEDCIYGDGKRYWDTIAIKELLRVLPQDKGDLRWIDVSVIDNTGLQYFFKFCKISESEYWAFVMGECQHYIDGERVLTVGCYASIKTLLRVEDRKSYIAEKRAKAAAKLQVEKEQWRAANQDLIKNLLKDRRKEIAALQNEEKAADNS